MNRRDRSDLPHTLWARLQRRALVWLAHVSLVTGVAIPLHGVRAQPASPDLDDATYVVFGRRDGIPDSPLLWLQPTSSGQLLLATAEGARLFDGRHWLTIPTPPAIAHQAVRVVLDRSNGDRVFVSSGGVVTQRGTTYSSLSALAPNDGPIYSAAAVPLSNNADDILVGARGGVFRLDADAGLVRVPLPSGMTTLDAMVAARRDGQASELWVGTRGGGVARRRDGEWTRWGVAEGLSDLAVEGISPAPSGDTLSAFAATTSGAFALHGNRWVPIGPRVLVTRVLRIRVGDSYETWLGTFGGELYRSHDDRRWELVELTARIRGSRTQVLTAVDHGLGYPTVYAAFRSGTLLRFRIGIAGRAKMPPALIGHPATALSPRLRDGGFWMWLQGLGTVRMPGARLAAADVGDMGGSDGRVRWQVQRLAGRDELFLGVEGRFYRRAGENWIELTDFGAGEFVHALASGFGPGRRTGVIAFANRTAAIAYDDGSVDMWRDIPPGIRAMFVDSTTSPSTMMAVTANRRVLRFDGRTWAPVTDLPLPGNGTVAAAGLLRHDSGECVLAVGTSEGLALLRTCGGPPSWRLLKESDIPALRGNEIITLSILARNRLAVGSAQGVTLLTLEPTFAGGIRAAYSVTDADGLPHSSVLALGPLDTNGRLWVGTTLGLGFVNTRATEIPRTPLRITALELRDGRGERLGDDAHIPEASARLDVDVIAPTHHREDDTQYRFELDGVAMHPTAWTEQATISLVGVAAGQHTLRVRARDYDGREAPLVERRFTVEVPWWRTGPAAALATIVVTIGMFGWGRSRTEAATRHALEAEENERRIAVSESRFRRLFEDGTDPQILVLDRNIWQLNAAADALFELAPGELTARPIDALVPGLSQRLAADDHASRWELTASIANEAIPVEVRRTRIPIDGAILDHLELTDLRERRQLETERAELEAQLRDAQRLESVGTLAGGVAHDFNNLLTVIHTNAELAASDVPEHSLAADALAQLLVASNRAREVVRQILTFSRRTRTHRTHVRIAALLSETHSLLRAMIPSTVHIAVHDDAPGSVVEGDATQLQQLLLNLCSNAEYAMRSTNGGNLVVRATWDVLPTEGSPAVRLSVSDTGVGISPEVRSRMFEPFYTTKPVGEGTGLGLSVLHGIVGAHGGHISVTSEPGRGATFDVWLPAHRADETPVQAVAAVVPETDQRRRILLVDDEAAVATAVQRMLERRGFHVDTVRHGAAALEYLHTHRDVDLLITDQTMPVMTGMELIERLRGAGVSTPIILASGFGAAIDRGRVEDFERVWWMDKPFASQELFALVTRAISATD